MAVVDELIAEENAPPSWEETLVMRFFDDAVNKYDADPTLLLEAIKDFTDDVIIVAAAQKLN